MKNMSNLSVSEFRNFFKYYADLPHQQDAIGILFDDLPLSLKDEEHPWVKRYRTTPEKSVADNPLSVPYFSQRDNLSGTGYRECFSSSCAMVANYWLPEVITTDDQYNDIRSQYGDSTDAQAQVRALRSLGLNADFISNGTIAGLKQQIDEGYPTPVGWLHHGRPDNPTGNGHYAVVIGYDDDGFILNDPYGECNLFIGEYNISKDGSNVHYSYGLWVKRWIVEGDGSGWMVKISAER